MKWIVRLIIRPLIAVLVLALLLVAPVGYVEVACRGEAVPQTYAALVTDPDWQRAESRTLTTYPEWHIVHAYDDYAEVIRTGDPHNFRFLDAVKGFWTALCPLKEQADALGGMTGESKATIYTIGVSFTAELMAKALYEETLGRVATWVRGGERAPLDDLSARQAADYAAFLQQVPWYKWDFRADIAALEAGAGHSFRDTERLFALRNEFLAKSWYAAQIEKAVAEIGPDALKMRAVVDNLPVRDLLTIPGVKVTGRLPEGLVIETPRYRAFTRIADAIATMGGDFVEIAGNDEILFSALSDRSAEPGAIHSFRRQGYGDYRHLSLVPVARLADQLRALEGAKLEHIHDY